MEFIYNLKGFIKKDELSKYNSSNLVFNTLPFSINCPYEIKDVHEIRCMIKVKKREKINIKNGSLTILGGETKVVFILSSYDKNETIISNTLDNFIFQVEGGQDEHIGEVSPFDIYFNVEGSNIFGKILCVCIRESYEVQTLQEGKDDIIKSLFL